MLLQKMFENNEYSNDTKVNDKLYKLSMQNFKTKVLVNDDNDLIPHHELTVGNPHLSLFATSPRNLQANSNTTTIQIKTLVENYPGGFCANNGKLVNQTQMYYLCRK